MRAGRVRLWGHVKVHGLIARILLECIGSSGAICDVTLTMRADKQPKRHRHSGVRVHRRKSWLSTQTVSVGKKTVRFKSAHRRLVHIQLNAVGKHLLKAHRKLLAELKIAQATDNGLSVIARQRATFMEQRHKP